MIYVQALWQIIYKQKLIGEYYTLKFWISFLPEEYLELNTESGMGLLYEMASD